MTAFEQIVLFVFRLINFGVLVGVASYLFKRYGLPILKQNLGHYRSYFDGMINTHRRLKQEQRLIEKQMISDSKEQDILKERLMRWLANVDDQNKRMRAKRTERKKRLKEEVALQQKQILQNHIFDMIMSEAVEEARKTLVIRAKSEKVQQAMFDKAAALMKE